MGLSGYQLLSGRNPRGIVGPDVYQVLLAKELVKHNFQVSYITHTEGGPPVESINGIEVRKIYPIVNRLNLIQKAFAIGKAMREAKADIYFQRGGAGPFTPLFCRLIRKPCIVTIASDAHVCRKIRKEMGTLPRLKTALEIRLADIIIVGSESHRAMLKRNFGKDGLLIKKHLPLPTRGMPAKAKPPVVLWVGAMSENKQPELFLKLAEAMPQVTFQMISGSFAGRDYFNAIKKKFRGISNLKFLGFIPFNEINEYFSRAAILVSTSKVEGFPHVFVQAWMNYTPVASLNTNPDKVIDKYKLGFHSKTFSQLVKDAKTLLDDEQLRHQMGENGRQYVEDNHDINRIVKKHIEVLNDLAKIG